MPARELNSLAEVINAAMVAGRRTPMGLAHALTETGRVVPEGGAAELARLQALMNAQPADLTPEQIEALETAGDRVVNDWNHDDQCACDGWPTACVSSAGYFDGTWDVCGLAMALPAVIGLWEVMRAADDAGEVGRLRARNADFEAVIDAQAKEIDRLRTRGAELEALVLAAGAAAEQRHQLYDPPEPPLACLMTGEVCVLVIADALADAPATDGAPC